MQMILPANNLLCNLFRILEEFFLVLFASSLFVAVSLIFTMGLELIFDSMMHCALLVSDSCMLEKSPAISVAIWWKKTAWNELLAS